MTLFEDDKFLIIIALTIISVFAMFFFKNEAMQIVSNVVSGLLGMAIGRKL